MKKTVRKKFIFFAMSAVSVLLVVLIGAINAVSWIVLDRESDKILDAIADGNDKFIQMENRERRRFFAPSDIDTLKSARFFMVSIGADGNIEDINIDRISSVTAEEAAEYALSVKDTEGKTDSYKYRVKALGLKKLIFFMDTSEQVRTFATVLTLSCVIAVICWLATLVFVILLSRRVVSSILAGMEKQKQFITNAGHELKTPLSIIQTNNDACALIYGETKYTKNIRSQAQRLDGLMTRLLTLARLDEEIDLPKENVNISQLMKETVLTYRESANEKGISLFSDIDDGIFLKVNSDMFSQMLSMLADNAIKYTPEGGFISFTLHLDGKCVEIAEENTCDRPMVENPERLFERFYREDAARTQENGHSGYGIGLSAARGIAESFGGTLKAKYTEKGIRFTARF